ncbi:retinol dehydrogenase 7-like [Mytilus californianus]|uniref:retinol dehydrogenase 7-like n=1 Tax=Mytilus californianus TaxID=6549 RepID=UPI00224819AE|nr:retinol dehydrogenase 7-like [Mytilus californianus]XP_052082335.1 retinol dehydrogenase 7-like [Mytilus californianus]
MMVMIIILPLVIFWITYRWFKHKRTIANYSSRYVFVTGCDSGFGNMLAKKLDGLGFNVFAGCLTQDGEEKLTRETSEKVRTIRIDVSQTESIENAFTTVKSSLPSDTGLWGVVNNAGIAGNQGPVQWLTRKDYQEAFGINTLGMVETTRIFLPLVIQEKGRIINITSTMGRIAAMHPTYIVSKFAAEGYSDVLRRELYKRGVTVHILEPGFFRTDLIDVERLHTGADSSFRGISSKLQQYYGQVYLDDWKDIIRKIVTNLGSPHIHLVVDAYVHALTSKYPKYRYLVGNDANYIFRILWNLPEWISDYLLTRTAILPQAERNS